MNKTAIKNYAIWARVQLIEAAKQKAYEYAVTDGENVRELNAIGGRLLTETEKKQRRELLDEIRRKGYQQVIEEAAYTWFNRFIALRFMEVNGYLPSMVRVFTDETGAFKPEILKEAMTVELAGLDRAKVLDLIDKQNNNELYQYLLITQCNALNDCLPQMFERIDNWTELLFPKNLLRPDGILGRLVTDISEEDWHDAVEIIGWLYQYYISEKHDQVIDIFKGSSIKKEDIPAATQLFTTDWVVRYILDNSLGRYWIERHPESKLAEKLEYFVIPKGGTLPVVSESIRPDELKVLDPCVGSGHFLSYAYDILIEIYRECGWSDRDAAASILENNLYGLDIDDRAAQLAYFAVMMKARKHYRRIFTVGIKPHIHAMQESTLLTEDLITYIAKRNESLKDALYELRIQFRNAKELGSIILMPKFDLLSLVQRVNAIVSADADNIVDMQYQDAVREVVLPLIQQAVILSERFHVVATNPPYLNKYSPILKNYILDHFADYKGDLFSVFMYRNFWLCKPNGYTGFMTPMVWMFIQTYEKLRKSIIKDKAITSLIQFEYSAFEEATVPICSFVLRSGRETTSGCYFRLTKYRGGMDVQRQKVKEAILHQDCGFFFEAKAANFLKIPGAPIAYWLSQRAVDNFIHKKSIGNYGAGRIGLITGDSNRFLRFWYEPSYDSIGFGICSNEESIISKKKWFPTQKGGDFRKWYGNLEYVVNWENDGYEMKYNNYLGNRVRSHNYNGEYGFKKAITWTTISSSNFACRYSPDGFIYDTAGPFISIYRDEDIFPILALMDSCVCDYYLKVLNPTINFPPGYIQAIPYSDECNTVEVINLSKDSIDSSKSDWDSFETSWDFRKHPLVPLAYEKKEQEDSQWGEDRMKSFGKIAFHYKHWAWEAEERFKKLKANEEELNRIFIDIYGLQDELTPEVDEKDVTVRKADLGREIRSLISYAVGCMFGRYSLDVPGLAYAGGAWDASKYQSFIPDEDNVLPICDDEYFEDDIVARFIKFIEVVYGKESLEENLKFIADALGGKGTPRQVIRSYFLNDFYADHLKIYQKRPIYWLFDSGKKNGFKCLIYMHRYQPDTIARIRTDYVHEQQERYRSQIQMIEDAMQTASTAERVKLNKQLTKFKDQALELQKYEEKIHHLADQAIPIDLDDGVKVNYAKFEDVLAKIK